MVNVRLNLLYIILPSFLKSDLGRHLGVRGLFCNWCSCWDCQQVQRGQQLWTATPSLLYSSPENCMYFLAKILLTNHHAWCLIGKSFLQKEIILEIALLRSCNCNLFENIVIFMFICSIFWVNSHSTYLDSQHRTTLCTLNILLYNYSVFISSTCGLKTNQTTQSKFYSI